MHNPGMIRIVRDDVIRMLKNQIEELEVEIKAIESEGGDQQDIINRQQAVSRLKREIKYIKFYIDKIIQTAWGTSYMDDPRNIFRRFPE